MLFRSEGVSVSDHTAVFTEIEQPTSVTITFTISQIMYRNRTVSQYVGAAIYQAGYLDTSSLPEDEAQEFSKNLERLKALNDDENTPEEELISCYSKVQTVIDELSAKKSESKNESQNNSQPESAKESVPDISQTSEITQPESANNTVWLIVCISAALAAAAVVFIFVTKSRKKK